MHRIVRPLSRGRAAWIGAFMGAWVPDWILDLFLAFISGLWV